MTKTEQSAAGIPPDRGGKPYLWPDLLVRRNTLALHREDLVALLQVGWGKYRTRENGCRPVSASLIGELLAMEEFVREETNTLVAAASAATGTVTLQALFDQVHFEQKYPDQRTIRGRRPYPVSLHDVAVGRAAAELCRRGYSAEVYRGQRRADLTVRRRAAGLLKNETAKLLGITKNKYYSWESGKTEPATGLLSELQAVDDFIAVTAARLSVTKTNGINVIRMLDDDERFQDDYPNACTVRDGRPLPLRLYRVAVGRLASTIEAAGEEVRIIPMVGPAI